ncbi:ribonuclease HII [Mahella australiensis]|uniref:Ribonuclease HII n=1 Tax=Mahella australiensis (strain DSM 15567 / CIP 107919 / 50-1 BON) TaxID=697281 RepID=F4A2T2_MAHA5|nr:ribonuclease HII [Mahella australiensis]AEE96262.1 Ribonuclease H [Mahella australiensis 50-1 BON]
MQKLYVAGVDEVGRGPLAGPVMAAAVILPAGLHIDGLRDSKKLTPKQRQYLHDIILDKALAVAIASVDHERIDEINIRMAALEVMKQAVLSLSIQPDRVMVDGRDTLDITIPQQAVIGGDDLVACISAASVVAKVTRDRLMVQYHDKYPQYDFIHNKGYGTQKHIEAIREYGICPIHRITFTKKFISEARP